MNRPIKFRAWKKEWGMLPVYGISFGEEILIHPSKDEPINYIKGATLMQFTGLLDKNGKEIWEDDLIECYTKSGEIVYVGGHKVELPNFYREIWSHNEYGLPADVGQKTIVKVIGNIYENPELLK